MTFILNSIVTESLLGLFIKATCDQTKAGRCLKMSPLDLGLDAKCIIGISVLGLDDLLRMKWPELYRIRGSNLVRK